MADAAYYEGLVALNGDKTAVRTKMTWLMLDTEARLSLKAYTAAGQPLGPVHILQESWAQGRGTVPTTANATAPQSRKPVKMKKKKKKKTQNTTSVALALIIGKESLTASGGTSDYQGSTNIGGTLVRAAWRAPAWLVRGEIAVHTYSTVTREENGAPTATNTSISKFQRLDGRLGAYTRWGTGVQQLACGGGLALVRMPLLVTSDTKTGQADLADKTAQGPFFGLAYQLSPTIFDAYRIQLSYAPVAVGKLKSTSLAAAFTWRREFVPTLATELGVGYTVDTLATVVGCPVGSGCRVDSTAKTTVLAAHMGLGKRF